MTSVLSRSLCVGIVAMGVWDAPVGQTAVSDSTAASTPMSMDGEREFQYDAFLSYSHADRRAAAAIQKGLHRVGRPMGRLRALRVFRDETELAANPDLWGRVTEAMDASRLLVLVTSPHAASSTWVNREL